MQAIAFIILSFPTKKMKQHLAFAIIQMDTAITMYLEVTVKGEVAPANRDGVRFKSAQKTNQ